jgi:hypothetical protein
VLIFFVKIDLVVGEQKFRVREWASQRDQIAD